MKKEEKIIAIHDYLENKMTEAEQIHFENKLEQDKELRELFDDEIMFGSLMGRMATTGKIKLEEYSMFQTADDHINMIEKGLSAVEIEQQKKTAVIPFWTLNKIGIGVAAAILYAVIHLFVLFPEQRTFIADFLKKSKEVKDSLQQQLSSDSLPKPHSNVPEENIQIAALTGKKLYAKYHNYYEGGLNDPAEISLPLSLYYDKKYSSVLQANEADYILRGVNETEQTIAYLNFYKAISLLEINKSTEAIKLFKKVKDSMVEDTDLQGNNEWFYAFAWLQMDSIQQAKKIFAAISSDKKSPYKKKASDIIQEMK